MFFQLSKILWPFISPLNFILLLFLAGLGLFITNKRAGRFVLISASILFITAGLLPLGHNALVLLEGRYHKPQTLPDSVAGIIVLGGAVNTGLSIARQTPAITGNIERVTDAIWLARRYPSAIVLFSGGEGQLRASGTSEGALIRTLLSQQGIELENAVYEEDSRNTYENALLSKELLLPQPGETWILVTSAYHMQRSMAVFEKAGWQNIIPWVTDYRTEGAYVLQPRFDVLGSFLDLDLALHEFIGYVVYKFTGRA